MSFHITPQPERINANLPDADPIPRALIQQDFVERRASGREMGYMAGMLMFSVVYAVVFLVCLLLSGPLAIMMAPLFLVGWVVMAIVLFVVVVKRPTAKERSMFR